MEKLGTDKVDQIGYLRDPTPSISGIATNDDVCTGTTHLDGQSSGSLHQ